jgi:hypothetical protein
MKVVMLLAVTVGSIAAAFGSELAITSPDHARTFAYGEMVWHQLYVDPTNHAFTARITLSNLPYVGSGDPRVDEPFDFRFPGVNMDPAKRTLFAHARRGDQITVALFRGGPTCGWIDLAPGAKIYLLKKSAASPPFLRQPISRAPGCVGLRWITIGRSKISLPNFSGDCATREAEQLPQDHALEQFPMQLERCALLRTSILGTTAGAPSITNQ